MGAERDAVLASLGFTKQVLCTAEEANAPAAAIVYFNNSLLTKEQQQQVAQLASEIVPPTHPRFQEGITHAHKYGDCLDGVAGRRIRSIFRPLFMPMFEELRLRVPTDQVVGRGGPLSGPHKSGIQGLLDSLHQDVCAQWFGASQDEYSLRFLADANNRPMRWVLIQDGTYRELFSLTGGAFFMNWVAAGVDGDVWHERQALLDQAGKVIPGWSYGMDMVLSTQDMGGYHSTRPSQLYAQTCYKAYHPSMKERTAEAATRTTGQRGQGRPSALQSAEERMHKALGAGGPPAEPHCGSCLTACRDLAGMVVEDVLLCNACCLAVAKNGSFKVADRPTLQHGSHTPCEHCMREGAVADPKRSAASRSNQPKNHNHNSTKMKYLR